MVLHIFAACTDRTGQNASTSNTGNSDSMFWADSALTVYRPLERCYNAGQVDSLEALWPQVRDFCAAHGVWWIYYTAWERKGACHAWNGDFDQAATDAEEMRQDAISRGDSYGEAMAYMVLAQGYVAQNNFEQAAQTLKQSIDCYPDSADPSMLLSEMYYYYSRMLNQLNDTTAMDSMLSNWHEALQDYPVVEGSNNAKVYANWWTGY